MDTVLVVSDRDNWIDPFAGLLRDQFSVEVVIARSSGEGRDLLGVESYALVLVLAPLGKDAGIYLHAKRPRLRLESFWDALLHIFPNMRKNFRRTVSLSIVWTRGAARFWTRRG